MRIRENMGYWNEQEVIKIRSTARAEELVKVEEEEVEEEDKTSGRRHPKLVRQSRVKESMSPRTIRCHLNESDFIKMKLNTQNSLFLSNILGCCWSKWVAGFPAPPPLPLKVMSMQLSSQKNTTHIQHFQFLTCFFCCCTERQASPSR